MEKITNIEIKNFKSIRSQKIEGCKRINVFVGKPNVGKSNILEALSLPTFFQFIDVRSDFSITDLIRTESATDLFFESNWKKNSEIILNNSTIFYPITYYKANGLISIGELVEPHNDRPSSKVTSLEFDVNLKVIRSSLVHAILQLQTTRTRDQSLDFTQPKILSYTFRSKTQSDNIYSGGLVSPYGENLMRVLMEDIDLRKNVSELFKSYKLNLNFDKTTDSIKLLRDFQDGTIFTIPYSLIADTLQRLIFYKAAIASNEKSVLLFEEPESHMYPPYISKFTSDIIYDENDNQYFIATHSPYVLNDFMEDAKDELSIYLVYYKDGETMIYRMTDEEMHIAYQFGYDFFMNIENFIPHTAHEKV